MSSFVDKFGPYHKTQAVASSPWGAERIGPRFGSYLTIKLTAEWLLSLILLAVTAPLSLLLVILLKLSSAEPAFYTQIRLGLNGRAYRIFKFRTMVHGAENRTGPVWASKDDCRVTSVGRFLRASHFDELPQLWNVLRGEMSLIGPRPERPEIAARITTEIPEFGQRLAVRPGITGLSQMLLPADDPDDVALNCVRRKLAHDLVYIRKMGLAMDLRIALSTPCYFFSTIIHALQKKLVRCHEVDIEEARVAPSKLEERECNNAVTTRLMSLRSEASRELEVEYLAA